MGNCCETAKTVYLVECDGTRYRSDPGARLFQLYVYGDAVHKKLLLLQEISSADYKKNFTVRYVIVRQAVPFEAYRRDPTASALVPVARALGYTNPAEMAQYLRSRVKTGGVVLEGSNTDWPNTHSLEHSVLDATFLRASDGFEYLPVGHALRRKLGTLRCV
jgi:hypothetical protein